MIRTILKSEKNRVMLQLPDDMVGKMIEVIAFEVEQDLPVEKVNNSKKRENAESISKALKKYRVDLSSFKFDRDEANDYE